MLKRAHIVKSVGKLDKDDSDIFRHSKEHLTQVLSLHINLLLSLVAHITVGMKLQSSQFCNTVNQKRNIGAKTLFYLLFVFRGVSLCPNWYLLLFPVLVLMIQCLALGLGLIISSLTTKYRDLINFFGVFVSLWMYATPIVYPLSYVTNPTLHKIMLLNPMTAIIETFKYGAYGAGEFSWTSLGYSAAIIAGLLVIGIAMFNRKQKSFIDTI